VKPVAVYLRVSTHEQTTLNQRLELESVAAARGWAIVETFEDVVSGGKGRAKRPGLDQALRAAVQGRYDVLLAWDVTRLGRSTTDLLGVLQELHGAARDLYLHQQAIDTTTPAGRAMFTMLALFAEFERAMIQERVKAGMARAKACGTKSGRPIGRPRIATHLEARIMELRASGMGQSRIAREVGCGVSAVQRVLAGRLIASHAAHSAPGGPEDPPAA
jgi:DNA invertase Pin-like site-specific DNA recombinase